MGNNRSLSSPVDHRYLIIKCYLSLCMSVFLMFICLSVLLLSVPYFSKVCSLLNVFHASLFFLTWICQVKNPVVQCFFFFSNINSPESFLVFSQIILTRVFVPLQPLLRPSLLPSRQRKMTCCHWRRTEFDWTMTRMRTRSSSALSVYCTHFRSWSSFCTFKTHFCFSTKLRINSAVFAWSCWKRRGWKLWWVELRWLIRSLLQSAYQKRRNPPSVWRS